MRSRVIDLIITMVRHIRTGNSIHEIKPDQFSEYDKSEVSAAYSWVLQKHQAGELDKPGQKSLTKGQRILHHAERMLITREAYGYLIELFNIGIIDSDAMESIIENSMMNNFDKITLEKMKELVARHVFGKDSAKKPGGIYLSGNERVN